MTATIHHQARPEHIAAIRAYREAFGWGGSFRVASDSDGSRNGRDAQRLDGVAATARAAGIGGKDAA